jgi:Zn-dependent M28 family amino/carboxypeptidase
MTRWLVAAALAVAAAGALAQRAPESVRRNDLVDGVVLLHDLQTLSADDMQGREVDTPGGARARAFVIDRFKASGVKPFDSYEQAFTFTAGRGGPAERHGVNVVGHIDGASAPARYIVVSAHYDHIGTRAGQVFNGADDNASGAAALFAVAKYFSAHRPIHSILIVAFDAEEEGLRGSRAFVAKPPVAAAAMAVNVNLDMIGRDPDDKLFAVGTFLNPFLKPYLARVAAMAPVKLLFGHDDPARKDVEDWTRDSDHYSFQQANIPAIYLGVEDFAQHHKATDDFETITFDFYIRATETAIDVIKEFDGHLEAIGDRK